MDAFVGGMAGIYEAIGRRRGKNADFLSGIRERLAGDVLQRERRLPAICHDLTHRRLLIEPHEFLVAKGVALEDCERFPLNALPGMPKPVVQVLSEFGLE